MLIEKPTLNLLLEACKMGENSKKLALQIIRQKYNKSAIKLAQQVQASAPAIRQGALSGLLYFLYRSSKVRSNTPLFYPAKAEIIGENSTEKVKSKNISMNLKNHHVRVKSEQDSIYYYDKKRKSNKTFVASGRQIYAIEPNKQKSFIHANIIVPVKNIAHFKTQISKESLEARLNLKPKIRVKSNMRCMKIIKEISEKAEKRIYKKCESINEAIELINRYNNLTFRNKTQEYDARQIKEIQIRLGLPKIEWKYDITMKNKELILSIRDKLLSKLQQIILQENNFPSDYQKKLKFIPKCFIGIGNNGELIKTTILRSRGWWNFLTEETEASFLWTPWKKQDFIENLPKPNLDNFNYENIKLSNHLEGCMQLGNKKSLYENMKKYYDLINKDIYEIMPMTFHIANGILDPEFTKFHEIFLQLSKCEESVSHNIWIIKPGENTNRGAGIYLSNDIDDIMGYIRQKDTKHTFILQKYIEKPLLFCGRKFDIRCFALMTSANGLLKGYIYNEGYLRTSSKKYTLESFKRAVHLTNEAVQIKLDDFGKFEAGNKISFEEFEDYLSNITMNTQKEEISFMKIIFPKIKAIMLETIKSAYFKLDPNRKNYCFELFGYDFMIDENFKVYLIEVNVNPCLGITSKFSSKFIPTLVENTLFIALDPIFAYPNESSTLKKIGNDVLPEIKYELVFDQKTDGAELEKIYKENIDQN